MFRDGPSGDRVGSERGWRGRTGVAEAGKPGQVLGESPPLDGHGCPAMALLERADSSGTDSFGLGMNRAALAAELGTVREVVVRLPSEFCDRGTLASAGRARYRIADRQGLELLAG